MFDYYDGFLHIYSAERDIYYHSSAAAFDRMRYLFCLLKEKGYRGIWFFDKQSDRIRIYTEDIKSSDLFSAWNRTRKKPLLFLGGTEEPERLETTGENGRSICFVDFYGDNDTILDFCEDMIRLPEDQNVFVIPPEILGDLLQENRRRIRFWKIFMQQRKNSILVLLCSGGVQKTVQELKQVRSLLSEEVCPELNTLLMQEDDTVPFYDNAFRVLKNRFFIRDPFTFPTLRCMLSRGILTQTFDINTGNIDAFAYFLFLWTHSAEFRRNNPAGLPKPIPHSLKDLEQHLGQPRNMYALTSAVSKTQEYLQEVKRELEQKKYEWMPLEETDPLIIRLDETDLETLLRECPEIERKALKRSFLKARSSIATVRMNGEIDRKRAKKYIDLLGQLPTGGSETLQAVRSIIRLMAHYASETENDGSLSEEEALTGIAEHNAAIARTRVDIDRLQEETVMLRSKMKSLMKQVDEMPDYSKDNNTMALLAAARKRQVLDLKQQIDFRNGICAEWENQISALKKSADALELIMKTKMHRGAKETVEILEQAGMLMRQWETTRAESIQRFREMEDGIPE